jgi:cytochrome c-type biogenesis protein CcmH/NrfG
LFAPFQLGRLAVDRGDYGQAVQHFERALKLAPRNPTIRHALAAAYRAQGQADKAAELTADLPAPAGRDSAIGWLDPLLNQVQALNVSSFELVKRGMNAARQGRYEQAVKVLDTALKINPNNASAWTNLGVASANLGQYHKALEAYRKAEELEPNIVETQLGIGRVLLEMGSSVDGAIERFEAVRQKDPGNATAMIYIAAAEMRRGRWEIALEPLQTVLARQPGNALARIGEARCLYALDRYADAKQSLEKGYRVEPRSVALADALARLLATCPDPAQRDGARSLELSQRVFTQAKTIVYAETVAMAYAELGRFDEAVKQQTWALTQSPAGTRAEVRQRIQENLNLYQDKKPCREPWPASCSYPPRRITSADEET